MSTPAGWYPDPTGRHQNRWFDGDDWTDQVADGQAVGVDPVRGGAAPATEAATPVDTGATQAVPAAAGPPPGAPVAPTTATPVTPAPGVGGTPPFVDYTGPTGSASGGSNKGLLIGGALVIVAVIVGLILVLGGGDDGGSTDDAGSDLSSDADQSDAPTETTEDDPSASDLFDDMADDVNDDGNDSSDDIFGTDDEPADEPADTVPDGSYPDEVIDNFNNSCTGSGGPADFCQCIIDVLQRDVAYDRFVEIDQELAADPTAIPPELDAAVDECQGG
jgi:hypothetical protein